MPSIENTNLLPIATALLSIITLILIFMVASMRAKIKRFLVSEDAKNIADSLTHLSEQTKNLNEWKDKIDTYIATAEKRLATSIRGIHTVRFNPFQGDGGGGNQSFATALLDENGDGVVISSLYSRDRFSVFSKAIKGHKSEYELSEEEQEAVAGAGENVKV